MVTIRLGENGFTARSRELPKLLAVPYRGVASVELEHLGKGEPVGITVRTVDGCSYELGATGADARELVRRVAGTHGQDG